MITGVILTHNEERNIVKCIEHLRPHVSEIILIDTTSDDRTVELATPLVDRVLLHPHVAQFDAVRNIAIPIAKNEWFWFVDADEFVPAITGQMVNRLIEEQGTNFEALSIPFKTYFGGQWMQHSGWWPGYTGPRVLKRGAFRFSEILHYGVILNGREIAAPPDPDIGVDHFSYRDISHWVTKSNRYTTVEAQQLFERGIEYDWRRSVEAMIRELWRVYERYDGRMDGERGWILAVCHAFYGWLSQAKLVDLGSSPELKGRAASVPTDLAEFLKCVEESLAKCRKDDIQAPIGILVRATIWERSKLSDEAKGCVLRLLEGQRKLVIEESPSEQCAGVSPYEARLLNALANGKKPRTFVAISFAGSCILQADAGAWYNILRLSSEVQITGSVLALKGYDSIFVESVAMKDQLIVVGMSPENIRICPAKSFANCDAICEFVEQLIRETEGCLSVTELSKCDESKIQVSIEGEFFAGHSFSNINEQIASDTIQDDRFCLSLKYEARRKSPQKSHLRNPLARKLHPCFSKSADDKRIVIRHAWPPDWSPVKDAIWVHIQHWEYSRLPADWIAPLQQGVDEIWVISRFVEKVYLESGIDPAKVHFIPWGIDTQVFRLGLPLRSLPTSKSFRFLFVGGTIARKGFDTLLSAYLQEFSASDDVVLVVKDHSAYAQASMRKEILASQRNPNAAEILYLDDEFSPGQLASLYSACNCLVAPYRGEGFALPVLEAMACGCVPLVPTGGATDEFVHDEFGYFVPSSFTNFQGLERLCDDGTEIYISVNDLRRSLRRVLDDAKTGREKGQAASEFARQNYSWARTSGRIRDRLQLLGERQCSPKLSAARVQEFEDALQPAGFAEEMSGSSEIATIATETEINQSRITVNNVQPEVRIVPSSLPISKTTPANSDSKYGRLQKGVLIQLASGTDVELLELTQNHHRKYAARHNLDYLQMIGNPACQKRPGWGKVPMILSAIEMGYERIVWLDADAVIVQVDVDLTQTIDAGLGLVRHRRPTHWNTGVIIVHASRETERFWKRVDDYAENDSDWMEQLAVNELLQLPENRTVARALDLKFNSVPGVTTVSNPVVVAGHGLDFASRRSILQSGLSMSANGGSDKRTSLSSREDFPELLNSLSLTGEAVEVGVLKGEFSESLLSRWEGRLLHAVDAWSSLPGYRDIANGSDEEHEANRIEAVNRLARFGPRCQIHQMLSADAASHFENGSLDFVYLDADHSFESVWQDLSVWYPKVRIGGILAGHDFLDGELPEGNFDVESAVRMFQQIHQFELSTTNDPPWRSWYFTKSK